MPWLATVTLMNRLRRFISCQIIPMKATALPNSLEKELCVLFIKLSIGKTLMNAGQSES